MDTPLPKQGILSFDDRRNAPLVLTNAIHVLKSFASLSLLYVQAGTA